MKHIIPSDLSTGELHQILLGTVAPRPIAFASTISAKGEVNLSPFSFFNVFSANPPILIFSPARRVRDNTVKHTLENVSEIDEVAISIVDYAMVQQVSLASTEYSRGVNEFDKAGFTATPSQVITPPYVEESPVSYECKVLEVKSLGSDGGAGNLVICEVVMIHISEHIYTNQSIDPLKLDSVARLGGNWYSRVTKDGLFEVAKPLQSKGIGIDKIPKSIRHSSILTGNELGMLGNVEELPDELELSKFASLPEVSSILQDADTDPDVRIDELHKLASKFLSQGEVLSAWKVLLQDY
ncbi:MAG: flavin reductase family protein [Cyclobacteriaceae bacterium]